LTVNRPIAPDGTTTLNIPLGIVTGPFLPVVINAAITPLALQAIAVNRLAELDYLFCERCAESPRVVRGASCAEIGSEETATMFSAL
jgi:hypothetical protein